MLNDVFGLINAGQQCMNMVELTSKRAVGAMPIGGRYRAIDFVLSNLVNSGIRNVGIVAQKNYHSLMDHLGSGKEWDLSRKKDGLFMFPPFDTMDSSGGTYRGMCDAVKSAMGYIRRTSQQHCLLSGSYTIYNTVYTDMFKFHMDNNADITIMYNLEDEIHENTDHLDDVRLHMSENGRINDMEVNSFMPTSKCLGMELYLIRKELLEYLVEDALSRGKYNFVGDVLMPSVKRLKMYGYEHKGYVGRLHSVPSYFGINMDLLKPEVQKQLFHTSHPIHTKIKDEVPAKFGNAAVVKNSLIANGCVIEGTVENSVLFRSVYVGKGTTLKNCIIMQDSEIYQNCWIEGAILDKLVHVRSGRKLIGSETYPVIIKKGAIV